MASYNRVVLVGNLTRDIELRYTPGGTAVAEISLAINERRKSASGEWVEEVSYVDVTMWGRTAEVASEYLGKGSPILVEGRLKQDRWESEGKKRSKLKVVCERMQMLSGTTPPSGNRSGAAPASNQHTQASSDPKARPDQTSEARDQPPVGTSVVKEDTAGQHDGQPTDSEPGYDDPGIPF